MTHIVVPLSGGKDSQLSLQLAVQSAGAKNVTALFCDTKFEHPSTYEHINKLVLHYSVDLCITMAGDVLSTVIKHRRFPSGAARFCTDELKMRPTRDFLSRFSLSHHGVEVWYGMRTAESTQRASRYGEISSADSYALHELFPVKYPKYLAKLGVSARLPIVELSTSEVFARLDHEPSPLYREGFDRVGCFPCLASGPRSMSKAFAFDETGHENARRVIAIGSAIGKDPMSASGAPCSVCLI